MSCCGCIPRFFRRDDNAKFCTYYTIGISVFAGLLLMAVLLGLCVNVKVGQNSYMITYNSFTTDISSVREQGTYTILPGDNKVTLTRTLQTVNNGDITCLSNDRLVLVLTVSVQFQYIKDEIIPIIFYQFSNENNFQTYLVNLVTSSIISTCGLYTAEQYYDNRGAIETSLFNQLVLAVNSSTSVVDIQFLQLKNIAFPDGFANIITQKQLVQQQEVTELNARTSQLINANTTLLTSQQSAEILLINANNQAEIILNQAQATKDVILTFWQQRSLAYQSIMRGMNLNASDFLQYLRSTIIQTSQVPVVQL